MYGSYFIIPKAVYFYCILPALVIITICALFMIIYHHKKGTYYYIYTVSYFFYISSILLCVLLLPLLIGYSLSMGMIIYKKLIVDVNILLIISLIILPIIPFIALIMVIGRFLNNLKYKKLLDDNIKEITK